MMRWTASISSLVGALAVWAAGTSGVDRTTTDTLTIGAYSVVGGDVLHEAILPRFARHWEQKTGRTVRFERVV